MPDSPRAGATMTSATGSRRRSHSPHAAAHRQQPLRQRTRPTTRLARLPRPPRSPLPTMPPATQPTTATTVIPTTARAGSCALNGPQGMIGYQYDADGNRIGKGTVTNWQSCDITANGYIPTTDFVLDQGGGQLTEVAIGGGTQTWVHTNVTASGTLIATYDSLGAHFYLNDALGSRRVQTDAVGIPEQTCQSLPYGDQLYCTGSLSGPTEQHFTGKERDTESGLDYFGARYYASTMGRWMSPDWADKPEAVPYSSLDNPQSLNLYGYVLNNPLSRADADGHWPDCGCPVLNVPGAKLGLLIYGAVKNYADTHRLITENEIRADLSRVGESLMRSANDQSTLNTASDHSELNTGAKPADGSPHAPGDVPDGNAVVRGGQSAVPSSGTFSGSQGATVEEAGKGVPHGTISPATAGEIRAAGGSVRPAPEPAYPGGPINGQHVNVTGGQSAFGPQQPNPAPKPDRVPTKPPTE